MTRQRRRPRLIAVLLAAVAMVASMLLAAPAQAANGGAITGRVLAKPTGGAATPFGSGQATAYLYRSADGSLGPWESIGSFDTASNGTFTATGLADGYYFIRTFDSRSVPDGQRLAGEYYDNGWSPYGATSVRLQGGRIVTLKDIVLERPGSVVGVVKNASGSPIGGASVSFSPSAGSGGYGLTTGPDGRFDTRDGDLTDDLIPGTYTVTVNTPQTIGQPAYASEPTTVVVAADQVTTHDVVPRQLSTATFTVKDPDGRPVANAPVGIEVLRDGQWGPIQSGPHCTDENGRYRFIEGFGAYKAYFAPQTAQGCNGPGTAPVRTDLVGEYWNDVYALEDASVISFEGPQADAQHTVVLDKAPTIKHGTVTISGTPKVGQTLTAQPGTWSPSNVQLSYQWIDNGTDIPGATGRTLVLTEDLEGSYLGVRVTGRLAGQKSVDQRVWVGTNVAPGTPPVVTPTPVRQGSASITGSARTGKTLSARVGSWEPGVTLSYQWLAAGKPIAGATRSTFKPTNRQAGQRVAVRVTGTAPGKAAASRTSAQSAVVQGTLTARRPTVKGTAAKGKKLTAKVAAWSPKKVTLRYQWLRNGKRIKGATSRTYRVKSSDVGKRITVRVTGSKKHFVTRTSTSKKTAKVRR